MTTPAVALDTKKVSVVNRYATPLAVLLVTLGVILTQPASPVREISIGLLLFGIVFNVGSAAYIQKRAVEGHPTPGLVKARLWANLGANSLLVYYLGEFWSPMWLLLTLTPIATAIYGTRKQTIKSAATVAIILLVIQGLRADNSPVDWGQQIIHIAYTVLLSLLANELVSVGREKS